MIRICFLMIFLLLTSCSSKFLRLMHGGEIVQEHFYETIPFDFSTGLPLIQVVIQGENYTFLLDTGAPNVISKELAEQIKYEVVTSEPVKDSQGVRKKQESIRIDNIRIGNLDFKNTGAFIIDFNAVFEMRCFEISGIIGANLMSKALWELDYEKEVITISDNLDSFEIGEDAVILPFAVRNPQQTPKVKIKTDQLTFDQVTFDTGATGSFGILMGKKRSHIDSLEGFEIVGSTSTGVYGNGVVSTSKYSQIDTVSLGNLNLYNQVIAFRSRGSAILGNDFLKEYRVIIDWNTKRIYLTEVSGYDKKEYKGFGILPKIKDNKMFVNAMITGSIAERSGIELGSQILEINDKDYRYVSDSLACSFIVGEKFSGFDTLDLKVLTDSTEIDLVIPRTTFIKD